MKDFLKKALNARPFRRIILVTYDRSTHDILSPDRVTLEGNAVVFTLKTGEQRAINLDWLTTIKLPAEVHGKPTPLAGATIVATSADDD